jgi:hypothetical protein
MEVVFIVDDLKRSTPPGGQHASRRMVKNPMFPLYIWRTQSIGKEKFKYPETLNWPGNTQCTHAEILYLDLHALESSDFAS